MPRSEPSAQSRASRVFTATGLAAIVAAGLILAATIQRPTPELTWLSAYLVLVVGIAQVVLGVGQAELGARLPSFEWLAAEWALFNLGNLGVITGTLLGSSLIVLAGTVLFAAGLVLFATGAFGRRSWWRRVGYYAVICVVLAGAVVGLVSASLEFPL